MPLFLKEESICDLFSSAHLAFEAAQRQFRLPIGAHQQQLLHCPGHLAMAAPQGIALGRGLVAIALVIVIVFAVATPSSIG